MHAALARLRGAQKVFVLDNNPARLAMAQRFDIDGTFLVQADGSHREAVRAATAGQGPDVVIVAVSAASPSTWLTQIALWGSLASMLCGAAQTLTQIVLFRLLQGVFGASLVPLSQAVLLDTYPRERHGSAMAMWGRTPVAWAPIPPRRS